MKIILSGIQPSGALHLGNYFGAMQPAIEMQGADFSPVAWIQPERFFFARAMSPKSTN